jgi:hypothetical protein
MARPCKLDTVEFRRILRDPERAILLSAGAGDLSQGFYLMLEIYAHLHAQGFRPGDDVDDIGLVRNENELSIALDPGRAGR